MTGSGWGAPGPGRERAAGNGRPPQWRAPEGGSPGDGWGAGGGRWGSPGRDRPGGERVAGNGAPSRWPAPTPPGGVPPPSAGGALPGRIADHARPHAPAIGAAAVVDLLAVPLVLLVPVPLKIAVDSVIGTDPLPGPLAVLVPDSLVASDGGLLILAGALQILVVGALQLQRAASHVLHTRVGERLTLDMRARLLRHAQKLSLRYHDVRGSGESLFRIEYDAPALQHLLDGLLPFVASGVMLVAALVVTLSIDWQLAVVALVVGPVLVAVSRRRVRRIREQYHALKDVDAGAMKIVQEVMGSLRVVKAFGREGTEQERFLRQSRRGVDTRVRISVTEGSYGLVVNLVTGTGTAAVLLLGAWNVLGGRLTVGALLVVLNYLNQIFEPLKDLSETVGNLQGAMAGAQRSFQLLDEVPEVTERPGARPLGRARGEIAFQQVTFSYGGARPAVEGVTFAVGAGERLGVVGPTGAGKTTLATLLMRFVDPDRGRVLLDGVDLRDYRLADLRRQFALVLQESVLLSASVGENILYARPGARREEVVAAARAAEAHDFISGLPRGYDTVVGERGMLLSGGERQRIALARAFLKDAPVLVLDEPTSAVDRETEASILAALDRLLEGRTALLISHRPGPLERCDRVVNLRGGRVVEEPVGEAGR